MNLKNLLSKKLKQAVIECTPLFQYLNCEESNSRHLLVQFFYHYNKILSISSVQNIIIVCTNSLESHIFSLLLVFSPHNVYYISDSGKNALLSAREGHLLPSNTYIILFDKKSSCSLNSNFYYEIVKDNRYFSGIAHPSLDLSNCLEAFFDDSVLIGDSIYMSSGSTGQPKLIPLNYSKINACFSNVSSGFLDNLNYDYIVSLHNTSFVIMLPFLYAFSLNKDSVLVAPTIASNPGAVIFYASKIIVDFSSYLLITVPSILRSLMKLSESISSKECYTGYLSNSVVISCGEPLDISLAQQINYSKPTSFYNLYGSTEVAPWILFLDVINYLNDPSNKNNLEPILPAGYPLPGVKVDLNAKNELLINSLSVFDGYLDSNHSAEFVIIEGENYFNTGDLFRFSGNLLYCDGRSNSAIKILGQFVNPVLIEARLKLDFNMTSLCMPLEKTNTLLVIIFEKSLQILADSEPHSRILAYLKNYLPAGTCVQLKATMNSPQYLQSGKIDRKKYLTDYLSRELI